MNNEMITVNGKHFIKAHLQAMTMKQAEKLFKKARVSDDTVREAWELANPDKPIKKKAEPSEKEETDDK